MLVGNAEKTADGHANSITTHLLEQRNVLGRIVFIELRGHDDAGLPASLDERRVGRIIELKDLAQLGGVGRGFGFESAVFQVGRGKLRDARGDADHGDVVLKLQRRHTLADREAGPALRVVKEQEKAALLQRHRLAVDHDGIGRLEPGQMAVGRAEADRREYRDRAQDDGGGAKPLRTAWPRIRQSRQPARKAKSP